MFIALILLLIVSFLLFIGQMSFGRLPSGERLKKIKESPNYRDGKFQNLSPTPDLTEGVTYYAVMKEFLLGKKERNKPSQRMPSLKTDLHALNPDENILVWFGHSSYFLQIDGKKILVDPVLSGAASPIKFTTPAFAGTDVYSAADFPAIDYLFISHDHWDHLDYKTIRALQPKIKKVITGLGTGEHFERWHFPADRIAEKDWNEKVELGEGFTVHTVPARHFSGRGLKRNQALWTSFVLETPTKKLFLGGDSGYDTHFAKVGAEFGPFDMAILECGQYDKSWKYIHLMPDEVLRASRDLKAKILMPVHWGKFALANHAWDESIANVTEAAKKENFPLLTPMIGEKVYLDNPKLFEDWWRQID